MGILKIVIMAVLFGPGLALDEYIETVRGVGYRFRNEPTDVGRSLPPESRPPEQ